MDHSPAFLALVADAKTRVAEIDIHGYLRMKAESTPHLLIDTREEHEWNLGRIPGAVHLGRGIIERDIERRVPEKSTCMVLYCGGGYRSALAADNLRRMGYTACISLDGGWRAWKDLGLPIEA